MTVKLPKLNEGDVVASFDPGGTTGICVLQYAPDALLRFEVLYSDTCPFVTAEEDCLRVLRKWKPQIVIAELFVLYEDKAEDQIGQKFPSVEVLGILRAWCYVLKIPMFRFPAVLMTRVGIPEAHTPLLKSPDKGEHARDAYKHGRRFILERHHHKEPKKRRR